MPETRIMYSFKKPGKVVLYWNPFILAHFSKFWSFVDFLYIGTTGIYYNFQANIVPALIRIEVSVLLIEYDFWLQALFIIAWSEISLLDIFQKDVLYRLSSIFITAAFLRFLQSMNCSYIWIHYMFRCMISQVNDLLDSRVCETIFRSTENMT